MVDTKQIQITDDSYLNVDMRDTSPPIKPDETKPGEKSERPAWLPEKFSTAEDLAKSYNELEKKFSKPEEEQKTEGKTDEQLKIEKQTGVQLDPYYKEYADKGELSSDSFEKLDKLGLPKDLVDSYIEGQKALSSNQSQEIFKEVGGQESYGKIIEWAKNNLQENEVNTFNKIIENGTMEEMKLAVQGMNARYTKSDAYEPNLISGEATTTGNVFRSTAEVVRAMQDPRYKLDAAYRKDVEEKMARSDVM